MERVNKNKCDPLTASRPPRRISWVWSFRRFYTLIIFFSYALFGFPTQQQYVEENLNLKRVDYNSIFHNSLLRILQTLTGNWISLSLWIWYQNYDWFAFRLDFVNLINFFCESNHKNFKISRIMWFSPPGTCVVGF